MNVYIVTSGSYSDTRILGVFSSRDNAEKFLSVNNSNSHINDHPCILKFDLDVAVGPTEQGLRPFICEVESDGSIDVDEYYEIPPVGPTVSMEYGGESFDLTCWAHDAAHAAKIASEFRRMRLAQSGLKTDAE